MKNTMLLRSWIILGPASCRCYIRWKDYTYLIFSDMQSFVALEWLGTKIPPRAVVVKLKPKCVVEVVSSRGTRLRTLGLGHSSDVEIYQSSNKGRTTLMIKIPKEYDLVSIFSIASEQSYIILFAMLFTHKHSRCNQNIENICCYCKIISRSI